MDKPSTGSAQMPGVRTQASRGPRAADVACAVGFACLLATLLLYSAAAMPFQRFDTLPGFVTVLGHALRLAVPFSLLAGVVALTRARRALAGPVAQALFAATFLVGNAAFCAMALGVSVPERLFWPVGGCIAAGCLGELLAWGRVLARYNLRRATCVVAAASALAALLGWAQLALGEAGAVGAFMACALLACVLPVLLGRGVQAASPARPDASRAAADGVPAAAGEPEGKARQGSGAHAAGNAGATEAPVSPAGRASRTAVDAAPSAADSPLGRARAFLEMTFVPGVGLALFAMLMAVRGELFFEDYSQYVAIQLVVSLLLFACMVSPGSVPLLRAVYQGLIPALSVAMLAFNYLSEVVFGGTTYEVTFVLVLYSVAALLTVSILVGMSHAGEFPSDLVVCVGLALFALVTVATQVVCAGLGVDPGQVRVLVAVTSGLYAAGMVAHALWRGLRAGHEPQADVAALLRGGGGGQAVGQGREASGAQPPAGQDAAMLREECIEERCDELARAYGLTAREREVLGHLARGHNGVYISDELLISPNTARTHIHNIYGKLGVTTREDVLRLVHG